MKRLIALLLCVLMLASVMSGCNKKEGGGGETAATTAALKNPNLNTEQEVTITLVGAWEDFKAFELTAADFTAKFPNCKLVYECLQDYESSLLKRLESDTDKIDIFVTNNIQAESKLLPYALDLFSQSDKLDLSNTFDGLIQNFTYMNSDTSAAPQLFCVPYGAEMRGMYVNKTLLTSLGLSVPANRTEFLDACAKLLEKGYIPVQSNPTGASQQLLYPYICNIIANAADYQATYDMVNTAAEGVEELFRDPMQFMYTLTEKG